MLHKNKMGFSNFVTYCVVSLCFSMALSLEFKLHQNDQSKQMIMFIEKPPEDQNTETPDYVVTEERLASDPTFLRLNEEFHTIQTTDDGTPVVVTAEYPAKANVRTLYRDIFCEPKIKTIVHAADSLKCLEKSQELCVKACQSAFDMCKHRALCYLEHDLTVTNCEQSCGRVFKNDNTSADVDNIEVPNETDGYFSNTVSDTSETPEYSVNKGHLSNERPVNEVYSSNDASVPNNPYNNRPQGNDNPHNDNKGNENHKWGNNRPHNTVWGSDQSQNNANMFNDRPQNNRNSGKDRPQNNGNLVNDRSHNNANLGNDRPQNNGNMGNDRPQNNENMGNDRSQNNGNWGNDREQNNENMGNDRPQNNGNLDNDRPQNNGRWGNNNGNVGNESPEGLPWHILQQYVKPGSRDPRIQ